MKIPEKHKAKLARLTGFERSVLLACMLIPEGKTRTYSQIAAMIGRPKAARAVGNALAKNPLAPIIPCHRVVKGDGTVGGYSATGGTTAKKRLIHAEQKKKR